MNNAPCYLCLDFGEKHIGVAFASTFIAEPIEVIAKKDAINKIKELINTHHITDIVMGISENETAEKTKFFAQTLSDTFHLPLHFHDETLTSQDTRRQMAIVGKKKSIRESKIDHYVAAAILQDFLDTRTDTIN